MEREQVFNLCTSILEKTDDGDNLAGSDLALVEGAVNGHLSERGLVVLYQLNYKVEQGTYEIPAFCGVENLTRDNDGHVSWKGKRVEHYDHDHWCEDGWEKRMKEDAEHLGRICEYLEDNHIEVNFENYSNHYRRIT